MDTEILKRFMSGELQLLYNLSKKLTTMNLNPGQLMKDLVYMLGELEGVRRVALYVANADTSSVSLVSSIGVNESNVTLNKEEGVVGFIFREGYPVVIKNLMEEPLFLNKIKRERLNDVSFIGVPIRYDDKVVGVITVDVNKEFIATAYLADLLLMVANLIGSYIYTYMKLKEDDELVITLPTAGG